MTYQEQLLLHAVTGRAAILDLNARHNRAYSDGDRERWIGTFRHSGASYTRGGEVFTDLRAAWDRAADTASWRGRRRTSSRRRWAASSARCAAAAGSPPSSPA